MVLWRQRSSWSFKLTLFHYTNFTIHTLSTKGRRWVSTGFETR